MTGLVDGVDSWRGLVAAQQPSWPDPGALRAVVDELSVAPPLVFPAECDRLRARLAGVALGEGFVLQGGDCAELFDHVSLDRIGPKLLTLLRMALVLSYAGSTPVVRIGRIAGQYAKPRSSATETRGGVTLPAYRGDIANDVVFDAAARALDPRRLTRAYHASATTLNLLRGFLASDETRPEWLHAGFPTPMLDRDRRTLSDLGSALRFHRALERTGPGAPEFYTSHEALVLDYESALTRWYADSWYNTSAHMVWIGERTRAWDGAHVEFASRIANPIGVKVGPTATADELLALVDRLDPQRVPGRLTLISRMGASRVRDVLPPLVEKVTASGSRVVWLCDPMHGNTVTAPSGHKTRLVGDILAEVAGFFEVHRELGTHPGGLHVEMTGDDVTECVGGAVSAADLPQRYESACDPRLNRDQALQLAFRGAELLRG